MATMFRTWSTLTAVLLLLQLCTGDKSCTIWSSAGPVVQRETSFTVYCSFNCDCKRSMFSGHPPAKQPQETLNSTTTFFRVVNITENKTYSCQCNCSPALDPCGLDVSTGYPPDQPKNISCIYKVTASDGGDVFCTWDTGRSTFLTNTSQLWVRTVSANGSEELQLRPGGSDPRRVRFSVSARVQLISVRVHVENLLGSAASSTINYTLRDIEMPSAPQLQVRCSSRDCVVRANQSVEHLELQYAAGGATWTSYRATHRSSGLNWTVSSLEPYRWYQFRARSRLATGLWSQWSSSTSVRTAEEAPAEQLDVWFAADPGLLTVYWKEANVSVSRGRILGYELRSCSPELGCDTNASVGAEARSYSPPYCSRCQVTVWARNSKGLSPPATITTGYTEAGLQVVVKKTEGNHTAAICWTRPVNAPPPAASVVEWYPEGRRANGFRWVRLSGDTDQAAITDLKAYECYEGAVSLLYDDESVLRSKLSSFSILETAPTAGPQVQATVDGTKVTVTWSELDRSYRMGCVTKYTVHLESSRTHLKTYPFPASQRVFVIEDLPSESYSLWVRAQTAGGEGPAGQKVRFLIQKSQLSLLLVFGVMSVILLFLVCLYQCPAVKQRLWMLLQCLMLDVVPDPANSKWAKECTQEKGKMNLQLQLSNSSTKDEEEPILVNVEELPKQTSNPHAPEAASSSYPAQTARSPDAELAPPLYPLTTYIKSFSQDSDSSDHTQTSLDTNTTVDYISSHGRGHIDEEEEEEEDDFGFFPSQSVFMEQRDIGGKLTLDAVKIDCSDFFQKLSLPGPRTHGETEVKGNL